MTVQEYLDRLRAALSALPEDERANTMYHYEDYFLDAGAQNTQRVMDELGSPELLALKILRDYNRAAHSQPASTKEQTGFPKQSTTSHGISFRFPVWLRVVIALLAVVGLLVVGPLGALAFVLFLIFVGGVIALLCGGAVLVAVLPIILLLGVLLLGLLVFGGLLAGISTAFITASSNLFFCVGAVLLAFLLLKPLSRLADGVFRLLGYLLNPLIGAVRSLFGKH